jgi:FkbM family methyltransferase
LTAERLTVGRAAGQLTMAKAMVRFVWEHPSNAGHRPRALLRLAGYQFRARLLHRRAIARLGERSRIWVDLHRTAASKVMYANPPDMPEMEVWRQALNGGGLFLDVGANVGAYTIWAAECGAEVIALEPAADTFGLLLENVALNGYQVTAIQAAAGARCGTARFTVGRDARNHLDPAGPAEARVVTIDSLIGGRHVAGMKVDVEGFEINVLQGSTRALSERRIGLIQLEWNALSQRVLGTDRRPVADLLAQYGYELLRPDPRGYLVPVTDPGYGADVFARPAVEHGGMQAAFRGEDPGRDILTAERTLTVGRESAVGSAGPALAATGLRLAGRDISGQLLMVVPRDRGRAKRAALLRECARVLHPGGVVLYMGPDPRQPGRWAEWCTQRLTRVTGKLYGDGRRSRWKGHRAYLHADGVLSPLRLLASCCVDGSLADVRGARQ